MPKLLNADSFSKLLYYCHNYPKYRGIIMLSDKVELKTVTDELLKSHQLSPLCGVTQIRRTTIEAWIHYENGSSIRFVLPCSPRGMRCNSALYSENVPFDTARIILAPISRLYWRERFDREYECVWYDAPADDDLTNDIEDSSELDSFLNSFKVLSQYNVKNNLGVRCCE